eukprot:COSAG02_NODE_3628_length_6450_cov_12.534876_9_plen_310_part_00
MGSFVVSQEGSRRRKFKRLSFEMFDLRAIRRLRSAIVDARGGIGPIDFVFGTKLNCPFQHWNHDWNWVFSCKRTQLPTAVGARPPRDCGPRASAATTAGGRRAMMHGTLLLLLLLLGGVGAGVLTVAAGCLGEYQECGSGECTLFDCDGPGPHCTKGEYRCPISNKCVQGAAGVLLCPGLAGTHLDHTLDTEERVSKLIAATNLTEQIGQLTNAAPAIEHAGIPAYNWLSDDEHGVRGWDSTYFPDGPGLGASFDKMLLYAVGEVVGMEARAEHNFLTHTTGMRDNAFNGDGITVYGPNMNLVSSLLWR